MDEKKIELLERSAQVFMRYGIKSVTMEDLSRELGVSKKTFYKYFQDKTALVNEIIGFKIKLDQSSCQSATCDCVNAIDELFQVSKMVIEHIGNINPSVFHDLKKFYPEASEMLEKHKWNFVLNMIKDNISRGISEGIYRDNLDVEVVSRLYVASSDIIMSGLVFQWPEFKFDRLFTEFFRFQVRGLANDTGIEYLKKQMSNEK